VAHANLDRTYGVKLLSRERTFRRFGEARAPREVDRENFIIFQNYEALEREDCVPRGMCARTLLSNAPNGITLSVFS